MFQKQAMRIAVAAALFAAAAAPVHAQIRITEVAPWGSGNNNTPYHEDWWELTNFGNAAVNVAGWKMDDSGAAFGSAVALTGITSIAPGESVIFVENGASGTVTSDFLQSWFGANAPVGLQVGAYAGSGVGLGTGGDGVAIFNGAGVLQASVSFDASTASPTFRTFDNAAGLDAQTITALSDVGTNGAFTALGNINGNTQIGSPGVIAAVPEPETYALMGLGLAVIGLAARRRTSGR